MAPTFLWGRSGHRGDGKLHRRVLDPDGCLARMGRSRWSEEPGAVAVSSIGVVSVAFAMLIAYAIRLIFWQGSTLPLDNGRLMGVHVVG